MDARTDIKTRLPSRLATEGPSCAQPSLSDPREIFKKTPDVADLKPRGRHLASDRRQVAHIPLMMKTLLDNGHLHGDCITAPGRTIAENLKSVKPAAAACGVVGLKGNFAPDGAAAEVVSMSKSGFAGPISRFDAGAGVLNVKLTGAELAGRRTKWKSRETHHRSGALWKYAQEVGPALGGAVIHPGGAHEKQCYADS